MLKLWKLITTGDWHRCNMRFVDIMTYNDISYDEPGVPSIMYTKTCSICGKHETGSIYGCSATSPDDLNSDPEDV